MIRMSVTMCHTPDGGHDQVVHSVTHHIGNDLSANQMGESLVQSLNDFWTKMKSEGYHDRNLSRLTTVVSFEEK